ncbi:MAG TPA: SDR family NAD(P)-dependent oxidoreductase [Beutenbergiaceae bacterium]|nr:SDR family NAD(P)-dependent oxidoreductase [Beutenbergiaceae bacterium]
MAPGTTSLIRGRALVTGGSSGIGLAFARALAARGCDLTLVARNADRLAQTAEELHRTYGVDVQTLQADLAGDEGIEKVAQRLEDHADPVQVFISNAGHGIHTPLTTGQVDQHDDATALMVRSVLILGTRTAYAMRERGTGVIVNVGSVSGMLPLGGYAAIKAWVNTFSEAMSLELRGTGVQVTGLVPGWVRTEFHDRAGIRTSSIPDFLWLDAQRAVTDCLADVDKGKVESIPSKRYKLIAFFLRRAPRALVHAISRAMMAKRGRG